MPDKKRTSEYNKRVCFGSGMERSKLRAEGPKPTDYPGPFEHYCELGLLKKYPNKSGYTLLASNTPRDKDFKTATCYVPPVGTYEIDVKKPVKQNARPFGVSSKLNSNSKFATPGPGTNTFFKRESRVCTSFGRDRITVPLVRIVCTPCNMAYCSRCEKTPIGDYWHKESTNQDMCRDCMEQEYRELKKCATKVLVRHRRKNELKMYTLMRYCGFYHEHNCTKAAVQHMPTKDLIFKLRKENYLASYGL